MTAADQGSGSSIFVVDRPTRGAPTPLTGTLGSGSELWYGAVLPATQRIASIVVIDYRNDGDRDIALHTSTGDAIYLDFAGRRIGGTGTAQFQLGK